ncbi:MAG: PP0621 family protein [Candidatus Thiodiazotropha sp.]
MGLRFLFFALAVLGVYLIVRHFWRQKRHIDGGSKQVKSVDSVQCAYCGLHLPKVEAVSDDSRYYCSKAHLKAAKEENS